MSRNTPPCSVPRPALTSALIARATSSRGSRSGVRRLLRLSSYHASASRSVSAVSARKKSGMYLNMKRSPLLFLSVPPSPRTPSVTRIPRTESGQTIAVGWNCVISMSMRSAPASRAVAMPAEVTLEDEAVLGAVEERAPLLELEHALGRLLRVQLRHAPVVEELAATHGVAEVDLPVVFLPHVRQRGGDSALGHDRVRLAQERLAHERGLRAVRVRFDRGAQARAPGADDDNAVLVALEITHCATHH